MHVLPGRPVWLLPGVGRLQGRPTAQRLHPRARLPAPRRLPARLPPPAPAADGSLTTGALVADQVTLLGGSGGGGGGVRVPLTFGVEERQYGRLYNLGADGLLALDRAARSFVGQVGGVRVGACLHDGGRCSVDSTRW